MSYTLFKTLSKVIPVKTFSQIIIISIASIGLTFVAQADTGFDIWKDNFRVKAISQGISASVFDRALKNIEYDPSVIKLDSDQPEFTRNIWKYLDNAISSQRLKKGQKLLKKHQLLFDQIEKDYGVQREVITAIWAMESDFGGNYGTNNIIRSLASLAYHGKRSEFAHKELLDALTIIQRENIKPQSLIGSWAGAMGQPQFMPSSYIRFAVDYDADGKRDLWKSEPDVLASIANFLFMSGWRANEGWGVEIKLPNPFDWKLNSSAYELRFIQWKKLGIESASRKPFQFPQRQAFLFIPAGRFGPVFLVTHNFKIIKEYNKSTSYSLAVAQLSQLLAGGESIQIAWPRGDPALSRFQIEEIQRLLTEAGHDPGGVDGKIGSLTREAIRTWQLEQGLAGDGYASVALLELLKKLSK